jgi:hypothetical protein
VMVHRSQQAAQVLAAETSNSAIKHPRQCLERRTESQFPDSKFSAPSSAAGALTGIDRKVAVGHLKYDQSH